MQKMNKLSLKNGFEIEFLAQHWKTVFKSELFARLTFFRQEHTTDKEQQQPHKKIVSESKTIHELSKTTNKTAKH